MHPVGFEPTIAADERPLGTATVIMQLYEYTGIHTFSNGYT